MQSACKTNVNEPISELSIGSLQKLLKEGQINQKEKWTWIWSDSSPKRKYKHFLSMRKFSPNSWHEKKGNIISEYLN